MRLELTALLLKEAPCCLMFGTSVVAKPRFVRPRALS